MTVDEKTVRDLKEDNIALREDLRRLRADLDVLRSGRLGTLGFKSAVLSGDNAIATRYLKDGAVTDVKIDSLSVDKLTAGDIEVEFNITTGALTWADGTGTLNAAGIQLESNLGDYLPVIAWLNEFADDADGVTATSPKGIIQGYTTTTPAAEVMISAESTPDRISFLRLLNNSAVLNADDEGIEATQISLECSTSTGHRILISNAPVIFAYWTSDPVGTSGTADGALIYRTDTDKFRARVNGAWVNLLTSADTDWVDLTDGGATTLHTHAGGAGLKTASGGYYTLPAMPSAGITVTSSASANTYGSWVEFRSASGNALYIVGISVFPHSNISNYLAIDIGTGAAASETSISEIPLLGSDETPFNYQALPFPIPVASSTRIAVRVADEGAFARASVLVLHVIDQADLVSI